jgi:molybdate transport system regulatory protein
MSARKKEIKVAAENRQTLVTTGSTVCRVSPSQHCGCLNSIELNLMEQAFRGWANTCSRPDVCLSRRRILLIFLLIRYTAAKLNEILALNPLLDINCTRQSVVFRDTDDDRPVREVQISANLCQEIQEILKDPVFSGLIENLLAVDPAFVRRKFYERAEACGFTKRQGGPEMIRKARAVELLQGNMPLPAVQTVLGHSTPNLISAYAGFPESEIQQVVKAYLARESSPKTSARNSFSGKIRVITRGDIQSGVLITTTDGFTVSTVITNGSLASLGLREGLAIRAEVKAPWVVLTRGNCEPLTTAENRFEGVVSRVTKGKINTEYVVRISDETELCAVVFTAGERRLSINAGDRIWALFSCFAVVLHVD